MAVIGKIREKAGWAVGLIAIGLAFFIVGSDLLGPNSMFLNNEAEVGKIAGTKITAKDFEAEVEKIKANYAMQGMNPTDEQAQQIREQVWQEMIFRNAYRNDFEKLGLDVTEDELTDMVQGDHIHPSIQQTPIFQNQMTKQFDKGLVVQYLKYIGSDTVQPQQAAMWNNFEAQLPQMRLREKYENLLKNSLYVTQAEAQREYESQTAKVDARYLYVPYYSIPDTTVKVTDDQLTTYLSAHRNLYKGEETRSLEYVAFPVLPSKKDSADLYTEIKDLSKQMAVATDDSLFAVGNSDVEVPGNGSYQVIGQLPEQIQNNISTYITGGVYGPFQEGSEYLIFKYGGSKEDTVASARASHILFRADKAAPDSVKAEARRKAQDVLVQLRNGASFEQLAQQFGTDGTAAKGGDLGWFSQNGQMVKPFENAVFSFNGSGLIPNLVETDFGYHIIKVTQPKTNRKYKLAMIRKAIGVSETTRNEVYRRASVFAAQAGEFSAQTNDVAAFKAAIKKDPTLTSYTADRIAPQANSINTLQKAREIVQWAFNDERKVGDVSTQLFDMTEPDQYVVAVLTGQSSKGVPSVDAYRAELTNKVRNQLKAEQIVKKLAGLSGTLDAMAQKYGSQAQVVAATDLTLAANTIQNIGLEPAAMGKAFGLKPGQRSKPLAGENGVLVVETTKQTPAPQIADFTQYKTQLKQSKSYSVGYLAGEAIKEKAKVEDTRYKFY